MLEDKEIPLKLGMYELHSPDGFVRTHDKSVVAYGIVEDQHFFFRTGIERPGKYSVLRVLNGMMVACPKYDLKRAKIDFIVIWFGIIIRIFVVYHDSILILI